MPVIGFLNVGTPEGNAGLLTAFRQGLRSTGYIEKQNVAIEYCWGGRASRIDFQPWPRPWCNGRWL